MTTAREFIARFGGCLASGSALSKALRLALSVKGGALRQGGAAQIAGLTVRIHCVGQTATLKSCWSMVWKLGGGTALLGSGSENRWQG